MVRAMPIPAEQSPRLNAQSSGNKKAGGTRFFIAAMSAHPRLGLRAP